MNKLFTFPGILLFIFFLSLFSASAAFSQTRTSQPDQQEQRLLELSETFSQRFAERRAAAEAFALANDLPVRIEMEDGTIIELQFIDDLGVPQYYITNNLNAARTAFTNRLWTGGLSGLDLMGSGYLLGIWDGGGVRTTHVEFNQGGLGTRVIQQDSPADLSNHATHVAGTMVAGGVSAAARGMAPEATLHAYDWNDDLAEMAAAAAAGLTVSNHSYGFRRGWWRNPDTNQWWWYGNTSISTTEDYLFGFYDNIARDWDELAFNAPHYLIVKSAGNERNDNHTGGHWVLNNSGNWVWSTAARDPDGGADGYDCMSHQTVSKNVLTVGAVHDIPNGWTQPSDVQITAFSSWGPTDDGRIKPDIVANGQLLTSSGSSFNTHYPQMSGTSMAAPSVSGTLGLLQEHYRNGRGGAMSAAALKGLVINTANEAGTSEGPDYTFGWGLLNATGAADLITNDDTDGGLIVQGLLVSGQTKDYTYYSDGSPITVTLAWTDLPGTPPAASLNPTTRMLVNDLNVRVIRNSTSTTYFPWRLNPSNPAAAATQGNNFRDNVEKVNVNNPTPGFYTIRVNHSGSLTGSQQAYALIIDGLATPPTHAYCDARSSNFNSFERITRVQMGSLDNRSQRSPGGYSNYTGLVNEISKGGNQNITVTIAGGANATQGRIWIDWNQNGTFDSGELIELGSGSGPVYSATVTAPANAVSGYTTMRVRVVYGSTLTPCNTTAWGETEDYTIKVSGTPGRWAGTISSDWHDPYNWEDINVPDSETPVTITSSAPHQPVIDKWAVCGSLFLQSGSSLTHNNSFLDVYGTFDAGFGQYTMTSTAAYLYLMGSGNVSWWDDNQNDTFTNVRIWKSTPDAVVSMRNNITLTGNGTFRIITGTFQLNTGRTLSVNSTSSEAFYVDDGTIVLSNNQTININGGIRFAGNSNANVTGGAIYCGGNFRVDNNTSNNIDLSGAELIFDGTGNQYIYDYDGGNLLLGHLTIDKSSGKVFIGEADMNISGDLLINNGTLSCNDGPTPVSSYNINISGDWTNNAFPTGFEPGDAKVVFNGPGHQYVYSDETFNTLESNMGAALRLPYNGQTVICEVYNWLSGGIDVFSGATFNALDLAQQGINGGFWVNPDAVINLYQDNVQWVDLNGKLNFNNGGTINIYGGNGNSWWAFASDATINMNGGVLDFKSVGITINNSAHDLNFNVTGGVIRTVGGISSSRSDFQPTAGTFEFYGSSDRFLSQSNGSTLYNVRIDKEAETAGAVSGDLIDKRSGEILTDGSRANNISLSTNFLVTNNLHINSGSLTLNGRELTVSGTCYVNGTLNMNNGMDILNVGTVHWHWLEFRTGSTANLTHGNIHCRGWVIPRSGSNFNTGPDHTMYFIGNTGGGISNFEPTASYSNVVINKIAGEVAYFDNGAAEPVTVTGDFTVLPQNTFVIQGNSLTVNGDLTDDATSEIFVSTLSLRSPEGNSSDREQQSAPLGNRSGYFEIETDFTLQGKLDVADGSVLMHGRFASAPSSTILIDGGSFLVTTPNHPDRGWQYIEGNLTMSDGLFEITNNSVYFGATATTAVSGGIIRSGGAFHANTSGVFEPTGGAVEIIGDHPDGSIYCYNGNHFHNLFINRSGGYSVFQFGFPVTVQNNFIVENGEIRTAASEVSVYGNAVVNSGGKLNVNAGGTLALAGNRSVTVNNGGALELNGTTGNQSKITRISSGHYALNIESGATIGATHAIFEYMNTNGVHLKSDALVNPGKAFSNSVFRLGQSGGRLMTIHNNQTFTVQNAFFPANTWGGNFNVYKNVNSGEVYFVDATGDFAGAAFEFDPHSRIFWGDEPLIHNISIPAGWSGLSSYLMPVNTNIVDIFAPVNTSFIVAQTMTSAYYPDGGINTIGNWASQSAYKVKMSSPATLSIVGYEEPNTVFNLNAGWNLVPVITDTPLNAAALFTGSDLVIAKDVAGFGIYWPGMGINTLGDLLPGSAYLALMNAPGSITFPSASKDAWTGNYPAVVIPGHPWNEFSITPSSHLIAIEAEGMTDILPGDIIGVFAQSGECFGVAEITATTSNALLTAYAIDPFTAYKDGFGEMELMSYRLFRPQTGEVFDLEVEYNPEMPQTGYFAGEGLSAIKMLKLGATDIGSSLAEGISIYPNPTDGMVWLSGISQFNRIEIISAVGQSIRTITNEAENTMSIDLSGLQPGVYQVRLSGENGTLVKRIVKK